MKKEKCVMEPINLKLNRKLGEDVFTPTQKFNIVNAIEAGMVRVRDDLRKELAEHKEDHRSWDYSKDIINAKPGRIIRTEKFPEYKFMDMRTYQALLESIRLWIKRAEGARIPTGANICPLCRIHNKTQSVGHCPDCPVQKATGERSCDGTPYMKHANALTPEDQIKAAKDEVHFLMSLLPNDCNIAEFIKPLLKWRREENEEKNKTTGARIDWMYIDEPDGTVKGPEPGY